MEKTIAVEFTKKELEVVLNNMTIYMFHSADECHEMLQKIRRCIEQIDAPQVGDRCAFWDDDRNDYRIGKLSGVITTEHCKYQRVNGGRYVHCAKIKKEAEF